MPATGPLGPNPPFVRRMSQSQRLIDTLTSRLSTGMRINSAADSPAGSISSTHLSSQLRALEAASRNAERAHHVVSRADAALEQVGERLADVRGAMVAAANTGAMSDAERDALQQEIDSAVSSIDRIADTTTFNDSRLLSGEREAHIDNQSSEFSDITVHHAEMGDGDQLDLDVHVTQSAQAAGLLLSFGGGAISYGDPSASGFSIEIAGSEGSQAFTFADGVSIEDAVSQINAHSESTGVRAEAGATSIELSSLDLGSDQSVSVYVTDDAGIGGSTGVYEYESDDRTSVDASTATTYADADSVRDEGQDLAGTINGMIAAGEGNQLSVESDLLGVSVTVATPNMQNPTFASTLPGFVRAGTIEKGPSFQLYPDLGIGELNLSFQDTHARSIGKTRIGGSERSLADLKEGGQLSLKKGAFAEVARVLDRAQSDVSEARARFGAAQANTINRMQATIETAAINTASARSFIRDADIATEVSALARAQAINNANRLVGAMTIQSPTTVFDLISSNGAPPI